MKAPNLRTCTEEELWKYVAFHLAEAGIDSVLVGGAVVSVYTSGAYKSGDLDIVTRSGLRSEIERVLSNLGFHSVKSRHFEHKDCSHLIIEFPPGPLSIGNDYKIKPSKSEVEGKIIKILSPTDCIRDRLASYIHFKSRECLDQAVLVAQAQPFDLNAVETWCKAEGGMAQFEDFKLQIKNNRHRT